MRNLGWLLIAIFLIFLGALYVDLPQTTSFFGQPVRLNKGIDLAGGARVLLCVPKQDPTPSSGDMQTAVNVIRARASGGLGVTEPAVSQVGNRCISAEMPGLKSNQIFNSIGKTGFLALTDSGSQSLAAGAQVRLVCPPTEKSCGPGLKSGVTNLNAKPYPILQVVTTGRYVQQGSAQVSFDTNGQPVVNYTLTGKGASDWCTYTTNNVKGYSAVVLDNQVVVDPQIQSAICGGQTQINGLASTDQAKTISIDLNYGALPIRLGIDSAQQVAATLGPVYVHYALLAGAVGLIIVALFMLLYYRLPGLLADLALLMYAAVVFALYKLFGVTFTLAAIAGFILSIGMAVDANILIFERMKEEIRAGKTLGAAVEAGFKRAFPAIRDSNASTIITTIILFWFGHNFAATVITGFATTLGLGVIISFVTAVFVSHTFLRLLVTSGSMRSPALFGVESLAGGRVA